MKSFGELFSSLRHKAGFETYREFADALAEEGYVYEDSIFSKWRSGERVPKDRGIVLALIRIFIKWKALSTFDEGNELLFSIGLRSMSEEEIEFVGFSNAQQKLIQKSTGFHVPNDIFGRCIPDFYNTRFVLLTSVSDSSIRHYWHDQVILGLQEYHIKGLQSQEFSSLSYDIFDSQYVREECLYTILSITTDTSNGREYLSGSLHLIQGSIKCKPILPVYDILGVQTQWPHSGESDLITAQLTKLMMPSWIGEGKEFVVRNMARLLIEVAQDKNIAYLYAIMPPTLSDLVKKVGISIEEVNGVFPLHTLTNSKELFPKAYEDYLEFELFWKMEPKLYRFQYV